MGTYSDGKEYGAILVDTSVFDGHGLKLEKGLLYRLKQFADSPIVYIFPDVIQKEVSAHISRNTRYARQALDKALNEALEYEVMDQALADQAKLNSTSLDEVDEKVRFRLQRFIEITGALELECGDYVSVSGVLARYFEGRPPFSESGKKKSEFPDAMVLMAVEAWSLENEKLVMAIAKDTDWKAYCDTSSNLDHLEDLAVGIAHFNRATAPYAAVRTIKLSLQQRGVLYSQLEALLRIHLSDITPEQSADSYLYWEPEGCRAWFEGFDLLEDEFQIVDYDDDWVVVSVSINISVQAEGDFSLSMKDPVDRDYVSLGSVIVNTKDSFESEVLITVHGNLHGEVDELEVIDAEVGDVISEIDFGTIEPNFGRDEYD